MYPDEPTSTTRSDNDPEPTVVTVTGSEATTDTPVEMIEGVTGARMPTGDHPTSGAMPDPTPKAAGGSALGVAIVAILVAVALAAFIKLLA